MTAVTMHHFSGLSAPFVRSKGTVSGGVFKIEAEYVAALILRYDADRRPGEAPEGA